MAYKAENREFTVAEAQVITGLSKRQLNNLIDDLAPLGIVHAGNRKRVIDYEGLFTLPLSQEMAELKIPPELREKIIKVALEQPDQMSVQAPGTNLYFYIQPIREKIEQGLKELDRAENLIHSNPEIMQGEPCLKGTRIPVYTVASIATKHSSEEAQQTFPQLSLDQISAAEIYSRAHPRQGRPRSVEVTGKIKKTVTRTVRPKKV